MASKQLVTLSGAVEQVNAKGTGAKLLGRRCSVPSCDAPHEGRGYCSKHLQRLRRHGDVSTLYPGPSLEARFWARVDTSAGPDACWPWTGIRNPDGYGELSKRLTEGGLGSRGVTYFAAHRLSWTLCNGPIPTGLICRHKCDNPPCVNPRHLDLGIYVENTADRDERGRNGRAKITIEQADEIRQRYAGRGDGVRLAAEFGISPAMVSMIVSGLAWRGRHPQ